VLDLFVTQRPPAGPEGQSARPEPKTDRWIRCQSLPLSQPSPSS